MSTSTSSRPTTSIRSPKPSNTGSSSSTSRSSNKPSPSASSGSTNTSDVRSKKSIRSSKTTENKTSKPSATKVEGKVRASKPKVDPASKSNNKPSTKKTTTKTHPCHPQHPLEKANRKYPYKCDGCKIRCMGERYACSPCKYNLHVDCMFARPTIKFQGYKCKFLERPLKCRNKICQHGDYCRSCDACGMTIKGFVYHCDDNKVEMDFHPSCTKLKTEIRIEDVIFRLQKQGSSKCLRCQRKQLEGTSKNIPGWSYVSNHNGYTFHVHCLKDMVMQCSSANKTLMSNEGASSSSSTSALQKRNITLDSKFKGIMISGNWLKVLEIFLKIVLPLLMGAHPATFLVSLAAIGVKDLVSLLIHE